MESKRLKRNVKTLLCRYIGQRLRENGFNPKGRDNSTVLDDLAHYDLAISVALLQLSNDDETTDEAEDELLETSRPGPQHYPSHLEREAMILSSFAGMLLKSLPIEQILSLYNCKPSASFDHNRTKGSIIHPFSISYHPFAMLSSFKAVDHSRKHTQVLKRWTKNKIKIEVSPLAETRQSSSSSYSFSGSEDFTKDKQENEDSSEVPQE